MLMFRYLHTTRKIHKLIDFLQDNYATEIQSKF